MMESILVIIEGEPTGKGRPRTVVRGKGKNAFAQHYTPEKTRSYEQMAGDEARKAMAGHEPIAKPVELELTLVFAVPASWSKKMRAQALAGELYPAKKPDIDNVIKAICDSFNGIVWEDDVQVVDLVARKRYGENPHVQAIITPINHPADRRTV